MRGKNVERQKAREAGELVRRKKQLQAGSGRFYILYLFMVLSLIYIIDEIASTISIQFQSNIINEFFVQNMGMTYGEGLSLSSALGFITYPVTLLIVFYRPLADRFGRKPFLVINTFMMGLGLFLVYLSDNIYVYMLGGTIMGFMVSHDMQCVYILECSNEKTRARNYALTKALAILGTLLIPLLRETLMQNRSEQWHLVYLVPALLGFVLSFVALLFARETGTFLINRVKYLETPIEVREKQTREERNSNAQGGILHAVKFAFRHRQLRFLMLACCFYYSASLATATYNTVMKARGKRPDDLCGGNRFGQIRQKGDDYHHVLFRGGILQSVHCGSHAGLGAPPYRFCHRRLHGKLLGSGRYHRRYHVFGVSTY